MTTIIAITCGIFIFTAVTLVLSGYGIRSDLVRRRVTGVLSISGKPDMLDEELAKPLSERLIKPLLKELSQKMQKLIPKSRTGSTAKNQQNDKLRKMVRQAGLRIGAEEYSLIRILVIFGLSAFAGILALLMGFRIRSLLAALVGAYAGFAIMRFHLTSRISSRRKSIEQQLPDVLDLLSINVEAGLGFSQALLHVIEHYDGPLMDELTVAYREMSLGRTRRDALNLLAERCGIDEIKTFVGSIVQADQLGISIKNVLRTQAAAMRTSRKNKVEEKAMKTSVKILLPMVMFIFPVIFIVLMGPAVVKVIAQFGG